jgi:hypothetical protein
VSKNESLEKLDHIGAFVSGFAGTAVIFWLCATLISQMTELSLQRRELALQRQVWQSTATSLRAQMYVLLQQHIVESLSYTARSMLALLTPDTQTVVAEADRQFLAGTKDAYIRVILEDSSIQDAIRSCIREHEHIVLYFIADFLRASDKLRTMLRSSDMPSELSYALYDVSTIGTLRDLLNSMMVQRD